MIEKTNLPQPDQTIDFYKQQPLAYQDGIPIFSGLNAYTENYERISADHLEVFNQDGTNPFISAELWGQYETSTITLLQKYARPGDRILDVGVGMGRVLDRFPDLQRYGMDISFGYLQIARTKGIEVCYALIEDMPYHPDSFDLIVCTDVLEHVLDLNQAVAKILSVLKETGTLLVRVPYREDLSWYASPDCPYQYVHLRNFDENSLRLLFERIFNSKVVETVKAGYAPHADRWKWTASPPRGHYAFAWLLTKLKTLWPVLYLAILQRLYLAIEINIVVKKSP